MEEQFVPYELALKLKELGFDEPCLALYQSNYKNKPFININSKENIDALLSGKIKNEDVQYITKVPIWQQAFDFMLKKINDSLTHYFMTNYTNDWSISNNVQGKIFSGNKENCLIKLIEIWKNKK